MEYKGYIGMVEYDDQAKLFHGDVINIKTVITFQGKSVDEIEQAFCDSIDDLNLKYSPLSRPKFHEIKIEAGW